MKTRVNVLYFQGTNCQRESIRAFEAVGASARNVFASDVLSGRDRIDDAEVLCIPGGFSFGDHIRAGVVAGTLISVSMKTQMASCLARPIICICNGFQIAMAAGLFGRNLTLSANESGTFLNRPTQRHVVPDAVPTPWLKGLAGTTLTFPCAHAEGRFIFNDRLGWKPALYYPDGENPDGSMENIAGITSPDGLILGLMDHPERALFREGNIEIFRNGVNWS